MPAVDLKGVYRVTAKGRTYWYAWRGPGAPRLEGEPGSEDFLQSLQAARSSRGRADRSRIRGLVADYRRSPEFKDLADKTRSSWTPWLSRIEEHFGKLSIAAFDRPLIRVAIRKWRDERREHPRTADMALQVLSRVLSYAVAEGRLTTNPVPGIPRLYANDRSQVIWTAEDLAALAKVASPEVLWAARLAALTGLRQGDLLRLTWTHVGKLAIEIPTGKSRRRKTTLIPLYPALEQLLAEIPRRAVTVLTNTRTLPWRTGFGASWQQAIKDAGVDKHFHDLRGTACTSFYLAGFSIREIAELMTWSEENVERLIDRYVKRDELLLDRIRRMAEHETRTQSAKPAAKPVPGTGAK